MLGIIDDVAHITTQYFKDTGDRVLLIGETLEELGASEYLKLIHGKVRGDCPFLDLELEKRIQDTVRDLITSGLVKSAHDLSEGGLAVGLAECCMTDKRSQIGCEIRIDSDLRADILLFAESQSRFVITVSERGMTTVKDKLHDAGVPFAEIGRVGGDSLRIQSLIECPISDLSEAHYTTLYRHMDQPIQS
jgi:phosphoribosylformylglycinamidine synthase